MKSIKSVIVNKWVLISVAVVLAFLVFHAPRIAYSLPWI